MIKSKEQLLLQCLRKNSRRSLAGISKETGVPVSTLFDTLKRLEGDLIKKHVSVIDFSKLGYGLKVNFAINSKENARLKSFLVQNRNVNSLYSLIDNNYAFYADCVFKDMNELSAFKERILEFEDANLREWFIVDSIKKEEFIPEF